MALVQRQARALPEPASRRRPSLLTATIGVLILGVICLTTARFLTAPLDRFDEGVTLTKAWLASLGEVPYRDFWSSYGPLDTYLLAAVFKLTAADVLFERLLTTVVSLAFMATGYWTLGSLGVRGALRWLMTALMGLVSIAIPALSSAVLADGCALGAFAAFWRGLHSPGWRWSASAGGLIALASLARPELAAALTAGVLGGGLLVAAENRRWSIPLSTGGTALAGSLLVWGPLLALAGPGPVFQQLVRYAIFVYPQVRRIPLGQGPEGGAALVMAIAFAAVWLWAGLTLLTRRAAGRRRALLVTLLVTAVLLFTWVRTRADGAHALTAWPPTGVLLAVLMTDRRRFLPRPRVEAAVSVIGVFALMLAELALVGRDLATPGARWDSVPRATLVGARAWMPPPELARLIGIVDAMTPADGTIWVGMKDNAQVVFNDATLYFLAGRRPATTFLDLLPAVTNTGPAEQVIICQLNRTRARVLILGPNSPGEPWNASANRGSNLLDRWITGHTVTTVALEPYRIVLLRPDPPPAACPRPPL